MDRTGERIVVMVFKSPIKKQQSLIKLAAFFAQEKISKEIKLLAYAAGRPHRAMFFCAERLIELGLMNDTDLFGMWAAKGIKFYGLSGAIEKLKFLFGKRGNNDEIQAQETVCGKL